MINYNFQFFNFSVSDSEKNFIMYMYCPEARESFGGSKLLRKADFHLGYHVNSFFRIKCKLGDIQNYDKRQANLIDKRHVTMFGN